MLQLTIIAELPMTALQDHTAAKQDWRTAATLFKAQGNLSGARKAQHQLRGWRLPVFAVKLKVPVFDLKAVDFLKQTAFRALSLLPRVLLNPGGELLPAFARLPAAQAAAVGCGWAMLATLVALVSLSLYERPAYTGLDAVLLSGVAFISLVLANAVARVIHRSRGGWAGVFFVAGATLLPLSLLAFLGALVQPVGWGFLMAAAVLTGSYAILTLYIGCTQIHNFWERSAAIAVPLIAIASGGTTAWIATQLVGQA